MSGTARHVARRPARTAARRATRAAARHWPRRRSGPVAVAVAGGLAVLACSAAFAVPAGAARPERAARYVLVAHSPGDYQPLLATARQLGATVHDLHGTTTLAIEATAATAGALQASPLTAVVARDHTETLIDPESGPLTAPTRLSRTGPVAVAARAAAAAVHTSGAAAQDPAAALPGLMWNQARIRSPQADAVSSGDPGVTVGIADTGLDFTHPELAGRVAHVEDFTATENPPLCRSTFGVGDADLAAAFGGPASTDWNGHGSWIGGAVGGALDHVGVNGIAPRVTLVALKIAQWCGYAYDSEILAAFEYATTNHLDVVSISFGGYLDRTDPDQNAIYRQYAATVAAAARAGTLIVASAGNEHVRIGPGGRVLSHGSLTVPGDPVADHFGWYQTPGGVPGVVDVSATGNVVAAASPSCPAADPADPDAACKPAGDAHQPFGVGRRDQLAYYSNYGPRIDLAAPGGARKFNLPRADRGGTPGFPATPDDGTTGYEDFSITSNWATQIPCYLLPAPTFHAGSCYSTIQGTSMATPHVSAVAALVAGAHPALRHRPLVLLAVLKASARSGIVNLTPGLSPGDTSAGELTGTPCAGGYCHLGGPAVPDGDAYGSGILDALTAVLA